MRKLASLLAVLAMTGVISAGADMVGTLGKDMVFTAQMDRDWIGHHDGTFENGYSWEGSGVNPDPEFHYGAFAEAFTLPHDSNHITGVRLNVVTLPGYYVGQPIDIYIWEGGVTGPPGDVLFILEDVVTSIPIYPNNAWREFVLDLDYVPPEVSAGFLVDSRGGHAFFIMSDENGPGGQAWTNCSPESGYPEGWNMVNTILTWEGCRSLGIEIQYEEGTGLLPAACCFEDGTCQILNAIECGSQGGIFFADDETCDPNPCPQPEAVCCVGTDCVIATQLDCEESLSGTWYEEWVECDPNPCPDPEAACCIEDVCVIATASICAAIGGEWLETVGTCDPNPCEFSDIEEGSTYDPTPDSWGSIKSIYR